MTRTVRKILLIIMLFAAIASIIALVYINTQKSSPCTLPLNICVTIVFAVACATFVYFIVEKSKGRLLLLNSDLERSLISSGTSVWRYDVERDKFETIFGSPICNRSDAVMDDLMRMISVQDREMARQEVDDVIKGKCRSTNFTVRCNHGYADDCYDYYKFDVIVRDKPGQPVTYLIGTERNVSLDKLNDFEYQNVLMSLNLSIRASRMIVWYYDVDSDMLYKLVKNKFVPTRSVHDFILQTVEPEERKDCIRLYQDLITGRMEYYFGNVDLQNINGRAKGTYECSFISMKNSQGKVTKLAGTCQDITEKHLEHLAAAEGNKRFTLAMKTSNFVLWEYDCENQLFTAYNEPLNNFDERVKLGIIDYIKFLHPDDVNKIATLNEHLSMRHDVDFSMELRFKDEKNGEWQFYTFTGAPFEKDKYGNVMKYAGIRKNNTHFLKLNNELKQAKEKAEKSDKLKTQFIANMTHEIRTPLNSIVGFTQLLQTTDNKDDLNKFCHIIDINSDMLLTIFNNVMDLSDLESGVIEFNKVQFDMAEQFGMLKDIFAHKMPDGVELLLDSPYSSFLVTLDWERIVQIFTNFVNNACKYTVSGSITIGYQVHETGVQIFCRDTGKGIAVEDQKRIFKSFEKVDSYVQGLGLGLSICAALVNNLGGKIGVQSELDVGSLFWATIPCEPVYKLKGEEN
jgi:signal transduction histidine kinase